MTQEVSAREMLKGRIAELISSLSDRMGEPEVAGLAREAPAARGYLPRAGERPEGRSLLWLPTGWGEYAAALSRRYTLFVQQRVIRDVQDHAETQDRYGLLTGRLLSCRRTGIPFVHIENAHRSSDPLPPGEDLTSFREFFWDVREKALRRDRLVVGWYHAHALLGLQLSERDRQLHVAHFQEEWPCALVVVAKEGAIEGGFFQRVHGDILFRRASRPFFEVISQRVRPGGGPYVTAVTWENYSTGEPVIQARRPESVAGQFGRRWTKQLARRQERLLKSEWESAKAEAEKAALAEASELEAARVAAEAARAAAEEPRAAAEEARASATGEREVPAAERAIETGAEEPPAEIEAEGIEAKEEEEPAAEEVAAEVAEEAVVEEEEAPAAEAEKEAVEAEEEEQEEPAPTEAVLAELEKSARLARQYASEAVEAGPTVGRARAGTGVRPKSAGLMRAPLASTQQKGGMVVPPLVMPDPLPLQSRLRRYAPAAGIVLLLAGIAAVLILRA